MEISRHERENVIRRKATVPYFLQQGEKHANITSIYKKRPFHRSNKNIRIKNVTVFPVFVTVFVYFVTVLK